MGQPFGRTPIRTMGPRKSGAIGQQKSQQPNAGIIDMFARLLHVSSAGRKACCELVRAAATADLARTGTLTPAQRAAAGRALAQLREIVDAGSLCLFDIIGSAKELRDTVAALAEVLSVSLREVASLAALPAYCECSQAEGDSSCGGTGLRQASTQGSRAFDSAAAVARPSDGGPSDWVPLVDCARVVSYCLFYGMGSSSTSGGIGELLRGVSTAAPTTTTDARVRDKRSNTLALVAALLHSDALPALSRLLSAEAQRGASLALLSPKGLTDCVQLLDTLMHATTEAPAALLPVALPASDTTRAHSHSYVPNPHEQQQQRQQQQRSSAAASPAPPTAASTAPQRLGPAVWTAMAQCAVVEAACRLVAMRLGAGGQQGGAGRWAEADEGSDLLRPLLSAVFEVADANEKARGMAAGGEQLPVSELLLRDVLAAPCAQYLLAAHAVSQLHAVDGGTTYGLPYDILLPPVPRDGTDMLSCKGMLTAATCWINLIKLDELWRVRSLSPRNLIELCLRKAEAAADSWRRRSELVTAAAGGQGSRGGRGRHAVRRPQVRAKGTSQPQGPSGRPGVQGLRCTAGLVGQGDVGGGSEADRGSSSSSSTSQEATCTTPSGRPLVRLHPSQCLLLALPAMRCSQLIMSSSGGRWPAATVHKGTAASRSADAAGGSGSGCGEAGANDATVAAGGGDAAGGIGATLTTSGGECGDGRVGSGRRAGDGDGGDGGGGGGGYGGGLAAWQGGGGRLAWRWWRAAVVAVHCGLDQPDPREVSCTTEFVGQLLDLGPYMGKPDTAGEQGSPLPAAPPDVLPASPPAALFAALRAGYIPCLERALRVGVRSCTTPGELLSTWRHLFGAHKEPHPTGWDMLVDYTDEKEAAALLATAAKAVRCMVAYCARCGTAGGQSMCSAVGAWWYTVVIDLVRRAEEVVRAEGGPAELRGMAAEAGCSSSDGDSGGGGCGGSGGSGSGRFAAGCGSSVWSGPGSAATAAAAATSQLSTSAAQQLVRLVGFGLPAWLPLCLELLKLGDAVGVDGELWRWQMSRAVHLVSYAMHSMALALERRDSTAGESWGRLLQRGCNIGAALEGWCEVLETRRRAPLAGAQDSLLQDVKGLVERWRMLDPEARGAGAAPLPTVGDDLKDRWPLAGLMPPPCDASQILACCSNPCCADLAGDSEAGVVLRRCGGACGGAVGYCCAACQRAHWAAGHKGECGRRGAGAGQPAKRN